MMVISTAIMLMLSMGAKGCSSSNGGSSGSSRPRSSAKSHKCVASATSNRFNVRADINVVVSDDRNDPTKNYRNVKLPWTSPQYRCTQATVLQVNVTRKRGGKTVSCFIHVDGRQVRTDTDRRIAYCTFDDVPPVGIPM